MSATLTGSSPGDDGTASLCCDRSTRVICRGDAFLKGLMREKRFLVSESHACSLIVLIITIDVFPNC